MQEASPSILRRHARALKILNCLQTGPQFNARELASRFKVSRRTIYRDLNLMREAGVPVFFDESYDAYRLGSRSAYIEPPKFDDEDLTALVMTTQLSLLQSIPECSNRVRDAISKLLILYPPSTRLGATRILNACVAQMPTIHPATIDIFRVLLRSIETQRQLRVLVSRPLEEDSENGQDEEAVESRLWTKLAPYRVLVGEDRWRVVGRSSADRCNRTFDFEQLLRIEVTHDPYTIPRGFRSRG